LMPSPKVQQITLDEAARLLHVIGAEGGGLKGHEPGGATTLPRGTFDLGANRSLVTDLSAFDAAGDFALLIEHPDPKEVVAAQRAARLWRETIGAFQLGIPVSTKADMLAHHLRLFSVMSWRLAHLGRKSRWHAAFTHYVALLADKLRALGADPFSVPATPDGAVPTGPVPGHDGGPAPGTPGTPGAPGGSGAPGVDDPSDPGFDPGHDEWLSGTGDMGVGDTQPELWSGKVSGLLFDHFGDFEGFTLESYSGGQRRVFSREGAVLELARNAWRERVVVTVVVAGPQSRRVRRLLLRGVPS
jgi:hypothetical protein